VRYHFGRTDLKASSNRTVALVMRLYQNGACSLFILCEQATV
jgi:hypothetical protein